MRVEQIGDCTLYLADNREVTDGFGALLTDPPYGIITGGGSMRRAARTDRNHSEVIRALRKAGVLVHDTSRLGEGFPDAVAARPNGALVLIEIKDGSLPPSARRLTPAEVEFHAAWGSHVAIVTSAEDALRLFGVIA